AAEQVHLPGVGQELGEEVGRHRRDDLGALVAQDLGQLVAHRDVDDVLDEAGHAADVGADAAESAGGAGQRDLDRAALQARRDEPGEVVGVGGGGEGGGAAGAAGVPVGVAGDPQVAHGAGGGDAAGCRIGAAVD